MNHFAQLFLLYLFIFTFATWPQELRTLQSGRIVEISENDYRKLARIDNMEHQINPRAIVIPNTAQDIQKIIAFVTERKIHFSVKSGGHSAVGYSLSPQLVILMKSFNTVTKLSSTLYEIGAGLLWNQVYNMTAPSVPIGGACPTVGVSGFLLGGGVSFLSRSYGLGGDQIVAMDVVTPTGQYLTNVTKNNLPLFWALNGAGGGNFGIVTKFTISTVMLPQRVLTGHVCWKLDDFAVISQLYVNWVRSIPKEMAAYGMFNDRNNLEQFCLTIIYNGQPKDGKRLIQPFFELGKTPISNSIGENDFITWVRGNSGNTGLHGHPAYIKSAILPKSGLNERSSEIMQKWFMRRPNKNSFILWMHVGGSVSQDRSSSSSFFARHGEYILEVKSIWENPSEKEKSIQWAQDFLQEMNPFTQGAYLNYIDNNLSSWRQDYYGSIYKKLQEIKKQIDPNNIFRFAQSIEPISESEVKNTHEKKIIHQMEEFTRGQVQRDARILEPLFAEQSRTLIPIGSPNIIEGKQKIIQSFASFFDNLTDMEQQRAGPYEINGNFGGFSKSISQRTKKGCLVRYTVMNWFQFDQNYQIKEFTALFNLTSVIQQNNC